MKDFIRQNITVPQALLIIGIVILIGLLCAISRISLIMPLVLLMLGAYLLILKKPDFRLYLRLGLFLSAVASGTYAVVHYSTINPYYIPIASIAMLTVLLFDDLELAFIMSLASSLLVSYIWDGQLDTMMVFFIGAITGAFFVRGARRWGTIMNTGLAVSFVSLVSYLLIYQKVGMPLIRDMLKENILPLSLNGIISASVVFVSLKFFEMLFGLLTNLSLSDLSDFNQPLLRRMILEAPGTYHHSLIVSNLSETAADAIGANALLARVGAYYHDIGKMEKPEYYTENQILIGNKHDKIEPSISRLVILNHVKEGMELAKKYKFNQRIIDFIPQHHGTSLMHFFYQRALEEAKDDTSIKEENYRYPGPKPQSRETAIVLLADSVEAAIRALDETNPVKIEEVVRKIINNKFIDGQLDECDLTLKDIDLIARTFTRVLSAMYHGRVKYPEKKSDNDNRHHKPATEDRDSRQENSRDNKKNS